MDNLIDRNAVEKEISKRILLPEECEYDIGYNTAMSKAKEIVESTLAVNRWIPVSERLPEKQGRYLCTLYYAIPPYHLLHPENDAYIREVSIQYFDGKSFIPSVVAWMHMPDAYEPPETISD